MTAIDQIRKVLAYHENAAAALRLSLSLLASSPTARAARNGNGHVTNETIALEIDAARRRVNGRTNGGRAKGKLAAQRQRSAEFLATFDPRAPTQPNGNKRIIGVFVRRGYLRRKGDGFIRTAKAYHVKKSAPHAE